jgi:hypothetical protein
VGEGCLLGGSAGMWRVERVDEREKESFRRRLLVGMLVVSIAVEKNTGWRG